MGNSTVHELIDLCASPGERRFFQALGMCLGYSTWAEDRKVMMEEGSKKGEEVAVRHKPQEWSGNAQRLVRGSLSLSPLPPPPTPLRLFLMIHFF